MTRNLLRLWQKKIDGIPVCEKFSCGAVTVASAVGCMWWVVTANLRGRTSEEDKTQKTFGTVRTTIGKTAARKYATILIISQEPIELDHSVANIKAVCRNDSPQGKSSWDNLHSYSLAISSGYPQLIANFFIGIAGKNKEKIRATI
jgi:hypothetical protein